MNNVLHKRQIENINSILLMLIGFFLPISVAIPSIIFSIILVLWIYEKNFKKKFSIIRQNKALIILFIIYFLVQVIGLLWTEDLKWGIHIVMKNWIFLAPVVLVTIVKRRHLQYYIYSFLIGMSISEILSYLIWLRIIPPFKSATVYDPTPFMSHISYTPFLSFTFFILCYLLFFDKKNHNIVFKLVSFFFIITISINIFITGGRAGQVVYFVMLLLLIVLYFKKNILKSALLSFLLISGIFALAYNNSKIFHNRLIMAKNNLENFDINKNTSVGLRINFLLNSIEIFKNHPIFGVGTGDFKNEYKAINKKNSPNARTTVQPHNMYILTMSQTGIIGLVSLLYLFYSEIKIATRDKLLFPIKLALPIFFLTIMFADSYLLGHYTTLLFIYFSSILYKDYNDDKNI